MIEDQVAGVRQDEPRVGVAGADLRMAWGVLENLAASLDQIGGRFGETAGSPVDPERRRALLEALGNYLTPELIGTINDARVRLGRYIPDEDAESLSEHLPYWDYAGSAG